MISMKSSEWLDELLALFGQQIEGAGFSRAYPGKQGSRGLASPAVTGEVDGEVLKPGSEEVKLRFRIFLPEGVGAEKAEELFAAMCALAKDRYPGFSAISRGAAGRDKTTGLLAVDCTLSFLTQAGNSGAEGKKAVLGGLEYRVASVKTSVSRKSDSLTSIGETEPFAVLGEKTEDTVELTGIEVSGLERLAGFTAELGDGPDAVYRGCRWKSLSDALGKAVFVSESRDPQ